MRKNRARGIRVLQQQQDQGGASGESGGAGRQAGTPSHRGKRGGLEEGENGPR